MNFNKTKGIIKRELKDKLFSKSFVIMTLLIPGIIFLSVGIQSYMQSYDDNTIQKVMIVTEIPNLSDELQNEFTQSETTNSKEFVFTFEEMNEKDFSNNLKKLKPLLLDESLNGIVFIPKDALSTKEVRYYSKNPKNRSLIGKLSADINQVLVTKYFAGRGIDEKDISYAKKRVHFSRGSVCTPRGTNFRGDRRPGVSYRAVRVYQAKLHPSRGHAAVKGCDHGHVDPHPLLFLLPQILLKGGPGEL